MWQIYTNISKTVESEIRSTKKTERLFKQTRESAVLKQKFFWRFGEKLKIREN